MIAKLLWIIAIFPKNVEQIGNVNRNIIIIPRKNLINHRNLTKVHFIRKKIAKEKTASMWYNEIYCYLYSNDLAIVAPNIVIFIHCINIS